MRPFDLPNGLEWTDPTEAQLKYAAASGIAPENVATLRMSITLRRVADGVERVCHDNWYPFDGTRETRDEMLSGMYYQWRDGNFSCGCNRVLFFADAAGEPRHIVECHDAGIIIVAPDWLAECSKAVVTPVVHPDRVVE